MQKEHAVFLPKTEEFLKLFPHRFDYIWSAHGIQPQWKTESRHPLHNGLLTQSANIYGVRFGTLTNYAVIDVDAGSPYHPRADKLAIDKMVNALEPLGIVASTTVTSSYSGGLHLYLPLAGEFKSWEIASAIDALLTAAGFQITKGWLEIFPNMRTSPDQLYAAHRLPMQAGSYVLGQDREPIGHDRGDFVRAWNWAADRNDVTAKKLAHVLKFYRRRAYSITQKGAKFLADLDAEIEGGWTGHGQTNHILGRIAMRGRCFGHLLEGTEPFKIRQLVNYIKTTAIALPGFGEWCRHQADLDDRAEMWARSAYAKYFPYGIGQSASDAAAGGEDLRSSNPWNQLQRELARDRIRYAVRELVQDGYEGEGVLDRSQRICKFGISCETLYQHLDLWHPRFTVSLERIVSVWAAGVGRDAELGSGDDPKKLENRPTSLLLEKGCDRALGIDLRRSDPLISLKEGRNSSDSGPIDLAT
jgi:hypothetical protein